MSKGIYKIENRLNGKVYIGSSLDIEKRLKQHKQDLKENIHHSYKLQNDFNEFGVYVFSFDTIEQIECSKTELLVREQYYIDKYNSYLDGYNCCEYSVNPKYTKSKIIPPKPKREIFNYVKIPREIIYDKEMNDKRVMIFSYLCARRSLDDTVAFSTTELCHWSKLKPNYRDGKINQKYYEVLLLLSHYGYFEECPDFESCLLENTNSEKYRIVKLNIDKFEPNENFAMIYFDEIEKILNFKTELENIDIDLKRMSSAYILLVLSYIRVNLNRQTDKPLCCYRYIKTIHEDIGLSERYISRVIEILDKLNIVKSVKMKRIRYEESGASKFLTTPTVFADYRKLTKNVFGDVEIDGNYDYREEIKKQIEIIKNRFSKRE